MVENVQSIQVSTRPRSSRGFVIRDGVAKAGLLLVFGFVGALVFLATSAWLPSVSEALTAVVCVAGVYVLTRLFRGAGEGDERPWWKLTATPLSSGLVSGYLLLSGVASVLSGRGVGLWLLAATLVCCVAFAVSALLMRRRGSGG